MTNIIGIKLAQRLENSQPFQEIITKYGCNIKTRIGLHNIENNTCSSDGIILLEFIGEEKTLLSMLEKLKKIESIKIKTMEL